MASRLDGSDVGRTSHEVCLTSSSLVQHAHDAVDRARVAREAAVRASATSQRHRERRLELRGTEVVAPVAPTLDADTPVVVAELPGGLRIVSTCNRYTHEPVFQVRDGDMVISEELSIEGAFESVDDAG